MTADQPTQSPERQLIAESLKKSELSIRQAALLAGMTDGRWRQIIKGKMSAGGSMISTSAPASTLARMAYVVGIEPDQLRDVGRDDVARMLHTLLHAAPGDTVTLGTGGDAESVLLKQRPDGVIELHQLKKTVYGTANVAGMGTITANATVLTGSGADEIDLIYASRSMSAREKLHRIRQVLELRALAEAEAGQQYMTGSYSAGTKISPQSKDADVVVAVTRDEPEDANS